jgi:hypothetical protein
MPEETRGRYFDELAKVLARGEVSRRKALRLMGAALVGGTLASIPGVALARTPRTPPPGKGGCEEGRTLCRGKCYDLQTSNENCGQCSNVCSQSQTCQGGTCLGTEGALCSTDSQCAAGLSCVSGTCAPTPPPTTVCTFEQQAICRNAPPGPLLCCPTDTGFVCCGGLTGFHCINAGTSAAGCAPN